MYTDPLIAAHAHPAHPATFVLVHLNLSLLA